MIQRIKSIFPFLFIGLVLIPLTGQLISHLPAKNYIAAMASGQYRHAAEHLNKDIANGDPEALNALANLYYLGLGKVTNYQQAAKLYHAAAKQGYGPAQLNLGHLYRQGLGVIENAERALGWYAQAHMSGSPWAEHYQSLLLTEHSLTPNHMLAVKKRWYKLAVLATEPL